MTKPFPTIAISFFAMNVVFHGLIVVSIKCVAYTYRYASSPCSPSIAPSSIPSIILTSINVSTNSGTTLTTILGCDAGVIKVCYCYTPNNHSTENTMVYFQR